VQSMGGSLVSITRFSCDGPFREALQVLETPSARRFDSESFN